MILVQSPEQSQSSDLPSPLPPASVCSPSGCASSPILPPAFIDTERTGPTDPTVERKGVGHGTGLGLSQMFGFAKQSQGDVAVQSELGRGTTFTLYLPAAEPEPQRADAPIAKKALHQGAQVLVVEDNREVGEFATQALTELGYRSLWKANADDALATLAGAPDAFDVVFSDIVMPRRSGIELAAEIYRLYPALPVVLASGYSDMIVEHGSGGLPLVHKPYSIDELAAVLQLVSRT